MITKSKTSTNCILDDELFKSLYFIKDNHTLQIKEGVSELIIHVVENFYNHHFDEIVVFKEKHTCPICGSDLNHNGRKKHKWNKQRTILAQMYSCSNPNCNFHEETDIVFIDKYCCYDKKTKEKGKELESIKHLSLQDKADIIKKEYNVNISRTTVYSHEKKLTNEYLDNEEKKIEKLLKKANIDESGIYNYDEEFCGNKKQKSVRLTILDDKTYMIINENIIPAENFDSYFIENFLRFSLKRIDEKTFETPLYPGLVYSLPDLKKDTLITDGLRSYPAIAKKLNFNHHKCIFHLIQTLTKETFKVINRLKSQNKKHKRTIKNNKETINRLKKIDAGKRGPIPHYDTARKKRKEKRDKLENKNKKIRNKIKKNKHIIHKYETYNERCSNIFKAETEFEARRRFRILYNQIRFLPDEFAKFLRNLSKDFDSTIQHIIRPEIPSTNNLIEGYFKITLPSHLKKIYRTEEGLKNRLRYSRIKWIKKMVLKIEL